LDSNKIIDTFIKIASPKQRNIIMTAARQLRNEGKKEGFILGEARGEKRGIRFLAKNLLHQGIDIKSIAKASGLSMAEIEGLK